MLDELLDRFNKLPVKEQEELKKTVEEETKGMLWIPSPGPQTDAYFCLADILLYGGAGGGGKSDLEIGLAITKHKRSLIMRRKYTDLAFLTDRTIEIMGHRKGFNGSAPPRFNIGDGQLIEFGAAQSVGDELSWMGRPHDLLCLEIGTKILLPDGNSCPIEKLKVGDLVATLEGPKPVEHIYNRGLDKAVLVTAWYDNIPLSRQVQGCDHSLLTSGGWVSHDNETGTRQLLSALPSPKACRSSCNSGRLRYQKHQEFLTPLLLKCLDQKHILKFFQQFHQKVWQGFSSFSFPKFLETCSVLFERQRVIFLQQLLKFFHPKRQGLHLCQDSPLSGHEFASRGVSDAQTLTSPEDYQDRCLSSPHQYGAPLPQASGDGLFYFPQLNGAERQSPKYFANDALEMIQKHIVHKGSYVHPYTKEKHPIDTSFVSLPLSYTPVGERLLYDITVKDANHYISYNGFVNKNCVDEAAHFAETQIRALMGWVRSTEKGQRVRVVLGSNPPLSDEGNWMFKMFAPWLDPAFPEPAKGGELRWCCVDEDDKDIWVAGPGQYNSDTWEFVTDDRDADLGPGFVMSMSRTFIPAKLSDNPFQNTPEYRAQQDGLPKHLRSAIRDGNFLASRRDHDLQLIPTDWIKAAMDRWKPEPPEGIPMCAIAADLTGMGSDTGGGKQDKFVIASRHDGYYNELVITKAQDAQMGKDKAAKIQKHRRDGANIILDMGGGYGDATWEHLDNNGIQAIKYKGAAKSAARTKASKIPFFNKRAETYFRFMEDLDPGQPGGSKITLPNDPFLTADLCSIRFDKANSDLNMIKLETKKELCARLGRSTDYGDPVVMAWTGGGKIASHYHAWNKANSAPKVVMSRRANRKRR